MDRASRKGTARDKEKRGEGGRKRIKERWRENRGAQRMGRKTLGRKRGRGEKEEERGEKIVREKR